MPPPRQNRRQEVRRGPPRFSRSPSSPAEDDPHLWPDEGSDDDPEYVPSESESGRETESETEDSESETETDESEIESESSYYSDSE